MEYIKWKKYNSSNQQGWINKDEIVEPSYQEVETVGLYINENDLWVTLAYSICNDEYLYPMQINKSSIIERYKLNKQVIEQEPVLKVQEEISKDIVKDKVRQVYNIDPEEFIKQYNSVSQRELCEIFNLSRINIERIIKALVSCNIIEKHDKYWRKNLLKKSEKREYIFSVEDFIYYYNLGLTVVDISKKLNIPTSKVYSTIKELVEDKKVLPRKFYLGTFIFFEDDNDLINKKENLKKEVYGLEEKEVEEDVYIDSFPDSLTGGKIKLQPARNVTQFKKDMENLSEKDLCSVYGLSPYTAKALINYLNNGAKPENIKTVKFLVDKKTGFKWVFPKPLIVSDYLQDRISVDENTLKAKYKLSNKVFLMLNSYLKEKGLICV